MAPGLFCVWSNAEPSTSLETEQDAELFSDAITNLPGVSLGTQLTRMKTQAVPFPYSHDIPFVNVYDLPDVEYHQEEAFKRVEEDVQSRGKGACKPRVYEEIYRECAEGCEDIHPRIGDNISIVTCDAPLAGDEEAFWKFQKEYMVPLIAEGSTWLRTRIFQEVGGSKGGKPTPSTPYLFIFEWEDDALPWPELTDAGQTKDWMRLLEGGLQWQAVCYAVQRYNVKFDVVADSGQNYEEGEH